jgi:hypothetical protein
MAGRGKVLAREQNGYNLHPNLKRLVDGVTIAGRCGAWHAALALALALPDICAAAEGLPDGRKRYKDWVEAYVQTKGRLTNFLKSLDGSGLYALRCAFLHVGDSDITKQQEGAKSFLEKIELLESADVSRDGIIRFYPQRPDRPGRPGQRARIYIPVGALCDAILHGVDCWANATAGNVAVDAALDKLLTIQPAIQSPTQ